MHEPGYLGQHQKNMHACLGCTLNDSLEKIYRFLKQNESKDDTEYTFTIFILLNYLLIEKLTTIFKVVGITQQYVEEKWNVMVELRKWANFVKHPKGFLFSHHAEYHFENEPLPEKWKHYKHVTFKNFVEPLYKHEDEKKFTQSIAQFENKPDLLVIIPDPVRLSRELIHTSKEFCEKIKNNVHFQEILTKHSVLENYVYNGQKLLP